MAQQHASSSSVAVPAATVTALRALAYDDHAHARFAAHRLDAGQRQDGKAVHVLHRWRETMEKARWTCERCGFVAPDAQEVGHQNGDHHDNRPENLRCLCLFCHLADHPVAALRQGRADLIYAPDLTQADVSRISWVTAWLTQTLDTVADGHIEPPAGCDAPATRSSLDALFDMRKHRAMRELNLVGQPPEKAVALYFELARQTRLSGSMEATPAGDRLRVLRLAPRLFAPQPMILTGAADQVEIDRLPFVVSAASSPGGSLHDLDPQSIFMAARRAANGSGDLSGAQDARQAEADDLPGVVEDDADDDIRFIQGDL